MATPPSQPDDPRAARLATFLRAVLSGKQGLRTLKDGNLFIEAICAQPDPSTAIYDIVSSQDGLASLQACMRFNNSLTFFNGPAASLLRYFQAPVLKTICGGDFLRQILIAIVKPPIFWDAFVKACRDGTLQELATQSFAWLLVELLSLPNEQSSGYHDLANELTVRELLIGSPHFETRALDQKIKHILAVLDSGPTVDDERGPGGRHDNDHVDFRHVSILPTPDELISTEEPFLLTAEVVEDPDRGGSRLAVHLDNQFRPLREDMLGDMREELQIVRKLKKGNHKGLIIHDLTPIGMDTGTDTRRQAWAMKFRCKSDIPRLFNARLVKDSPQQRKTHLRDNRNLFRHQSVACLMLDGEVAAFPTINRDEDLLTQRPPVIVLQFAGDANTAKALLKLKMAKQVSLVQIDTAIFTYAPILRRLQDAKELPLLEDLLSWSASRSMPEPPTRPLGIIAKIQSNPSADLKDVLKTAMSVRLDPSQTASLLSGLTQSVSLIQGPPGEDSRCPFNICQL